MHLMNAVYSANLGCTIDLETFCQRVKKAKYGRKRLPAVIWQDPRIGGNCLVFSNGKINCNGKVSNFLEGQRITSCVSVLAVT